MGREGWWVERHPRTAARRLQLRTGETGFFRAVPVNFGVRPRSAGPEINAVIRRNCHMVKRKDGFSGREWVDEVARVDLRTGRQSGRGGGKVWDWRTRMLEYVDLSLF